MGVLTFPQKYRLLSEHWHFMPTSKDVAKALAVSAGELSRWSNGKTVKTTESETRLTRALADYFDDIRLLDARGVTKSEFVSMIEAEDDLIFLNMVKQRYSPLPRLTGIQSVEDLRSSLRFRKADILLGNSNERVFFLYRLGFNAGSGFRKREDKLLPPSGPSRNEAKLVMRRIPARIRHADPQDEYFTYEEYYVDELAESGAEKIYTAIASGYVFRDFLTIFSKDVRGEAGNLIEISVAQIDLSSRSNGQFSGIVSMRSDCSAHVERWDPTSYRVVLRTAPPDIPWDDEISSDGTLVKKGAKSLSKTVAIIDINKDSVIDEDDFIKVAADGVDDGANLARMFNRLNVLATPADLLVAHPIEYVRKKGRHLEA